MNTPRRSRRSVSSLNQRSTRLSHDEQVGVKCRCQRARLGSASHLATGGALCAERLSSTTWISRSSGHVEVDQLEEGQHVVGRVALPGVVEDLAGGDVHRGEQIGRAVALVVVGHGAGPARLHRQRRLGAVERLDLGLLVEAEDHRPFGGVHVEPDHVDQLLLEVAGRSRP